jgi:hypothetical protein
LAIYNRELGFVSTFLLIREIFDSIRYYQEFEQIYRFSAKFLGKKFIFCNNFANNITELIADGFSKISHKAIILGPIELKNLKYDFKIAGQCFEIEEIKVQNSFLQLYGKQIIAQTQFTLDLKDSEKLIIDINYNGKKIELKYNQDQVKIEQDDGLKLVKFDQRFKLEVMESLFNLIAKLSSHIKQQEVTTDISKLDYRDKTKDDSGDQVITPTSSAKALVMERYLGNRNKSHKSVLANNNIQVAK